MHKSNTNPLLILLVISLILTGSTMGGIACLVLAVLAVGSFLPVAVSRCRAYLVGTRRTLRWQPRTIPRPLFWLPQTFVPVAVRLDLRQSARRF